ncbi:amidase [Streptomyces sp. NPDC056178]|uniref:amidase n=1 Tax=Streptomyces sp. NPDC056178 TaxID=3345735 RepID=UPI0035DCD839
MPPSATAVPPHEFSLTRAVRALESGELTATALLADCLDRIDAREPVVGAWEHLDRDAAVRRARLLDDGPRQGLLHGVPVGVKDIIDTADQPTGYGSPRHRGHRPDRDAWCVARLRASGAVLVGKTVTTEFAYFTPGRTANPHAPHHTPGGSSSGSAAAVADRMVPLALGTQTAGSTIRPAAYCGTAGHVATPGAFPLTGIAGLSHTLDSLGLLTRTVEDLALARAALLGRAAHSRDAVLPDVPHPVVLICSGTGPGVPDRTAYGFHPTDGAMDRAMEDTRLTLLAAGAEVRELAIDADLAELVRTHATVMAYEAARALATEYDAGALNTTHTTDDTRAASDAYAAGPPVGPPGEQPLSAPLRRLVEDGHRVSRFDYLAALDHAAAQRRRLQALLESADAVLAPAAAGPAPAGLTATGSPVFSRPWQVLGLPAVAVPGHRDADGLPLGVQLIGRVGGDEHLLAVAHRVERLLAASDG